MRKIVLVEPTGSGIHVYSRWFIPRLGPILLGTILRDLGYQVRVIVGRIGPAEAAAMYEADLVGISTITPTAPAAYHLARALSRAEVPVVLGGVHVTFEPDEALRYCDYVVRGEGEDTFVELIHALEDGGDLSKIAGLSYRRDGQNFHNATRPFEENLDRFPIPDFSLTGNRVRGAVLSLLTRRGCPFDCSFCSVAPFNGRKPRDVSVDKVLDEIEHHVKAGPPWTIFIADDIFNLNPERAKAILRGVLRRRLTRTWFSCQMRHEGARDPELLALMHETGVCRVYVGFESVNPKTLQAYGKHETVEEIIQSVHAFRKAKIRVHGMFVFGSDEDTPETLMSTADFARTHGIDTVQFTILTPLPGSRDYDEFKAGRRKILTKNWSYYDGHHVVHEPAKMTPLELQRAAIDAMARFYSRAGILKTLLKGSGKEAFVQTYARHIIKGWVRENADYFRWLAGDPASIEAPQHRDRAVRVGIPVTQGGWAASLSHLLKGLGVRVRPLRGTMAHVESNFAEITDDPQQFARRACDWFRSLKGNVTHVLWPHVRGERPPEWVPMLRAIALSLNHVSPEFPVFIPVSLPSEREALRRCLHQIATRFSENLARRKEAVRRTLRSWKSAKRAD